MFAVLGIDKIRSAFSMNPLKSHSGVKNPLHGRPQGVLSQLPEVVTKWGNL